MQKLINKIALVTGASRGIGKGIAISLARCGATVYITGRTERIEDSPTLLPGTIYETEQQIINEGGKCKAIRCDHTVDQEVDMVFDQIFREQGRLDILVNAAWGGYEYFNDGSEFWLEQGFWEAPISRWDKMFNAGVRASYYASTKAAQKMVEAKSGIIFNLSFWASQRNDKGVSYCSSKAATDKMTESMAYDLRNSNVPVICLYPGIVRTEAVLKGEDHFNLTNSESPEFIGLVIAELATDPNAMSKSGKILVAASEAIEYGVKDVDGKQPKPLSVDEV